jgi:hypothetical protein
MKITDSVIAVFPVHDGADIAVKRLAAGGFDMKNLSVVGKGFHSEEKVIGFYNAGDRVIFWGKRGVFWGGLWGLFFGGVFLTVPVIGHLVLLGYLAGTAISVIEGAIVFGGLSAVGAALYSIGVPKDSIVHYEMAMKSEGFLVMAHGTPDDMIRAREILDKLSPSRVDLHTVGGRDLAHTG